MFKLGLIGSGISRSRMPKLQAYLGQLCGLSIDYQLIDTQGVDGFCLQTEVNRLQRSGYRGLNITHPYKEAVVPLAEPLIDTVRTIGAMNTLLFSDGGCQGATTDYTGFKRGYRQKLKERKPGSVLIAGAGGVGRAIAFALGALGAERLFIFDTNSSQVGALVEALINSGIPATAVENKMLADVASGVTGLVNATPLGMHKAPGTVFPADLIGNQQWAFDAVYTPLNTEFIISCRSAGLDIISGSDLWLFQGIDAFELFTGIRVDSCQAQKEAISWLE